MFQTSVIFERNYNSVAEVVVNQGGTSSGKTYSILQVLCLKAIEQPDQVISVVGQDVPNLKSGALRDMQSIVASSTDIQSWIKGYNASDRIFTFHNGSIIEFKSYQDSQDAKSGKRDYFFLNEANGISFEIYSELAMRTKKKVYIDYNPNARFWVHDKLIGKEGTELIISDHRHNPFLPDIIRKKIEALREDDEELWKVYARGVTGKIEGLIYRNWGTIGTIPTEAQLIGMGLDFGFTNDPTACVMVYRYNGELIIDELLYHKGYTNQDISQFFTQSGINKSVSIIADSAEPKSIEELRRMGWRVEGANKGKDSILNGIDILKRFRFSVTSRSSNLIKELNAYKWKEKDGNATNVPIDSFNHGMDALRYLALNKLAEKNRGIYGIK
jgi:phage terminase large subunit